MKTMRKWRGFVILLLIALNAGWAQNDYNLCLCPETEQPFSDDYFQNSVNNGLIRANIGFSGTVQWNTGCFPLANAACVTLNAPGSITFGTVSGSSLLSDSSYALNSAAPYTSIPGGAFFTLMVDGQPQLWGDDSGNFRRLWPGVSGPYLRYQWNKDDLVTDLRLELVQHVFRLELTITNSGTDPIDLGLRFASDLESGVELNPRSSQQPYLYIPGQRPIRTDTDLRGLNVPNQLEFYYQRDVLTASSRYLMRPVPGFDDPASAPTTVDRLVVAGWANVMAAGAQARLWDPILFPDGPIDRFDPSIAMFYNPRVLAPGQTRTYRIYVMLTPIDMNVARPLAVGVETVPVVDYLPGGLNSVAPNPFDVYCNITNQYFDVGLEVDITDVQASISLPPGCRLAKRGDPLPNNQFVTEDEVPTKKISVLRADATATVRWRVVAEGEIPGPAAIRVAVSASPAPSKTVSRTFYIAATNRRKYVQGTQLISLPFQTNALIETVFQELPPASFLARRWDPNLEKYLQVEQPTPGQGFWLRAEQLPTNGVVNLSDVEPLRGEFTQSYAMNIDKGWNQVGNPYVYPLVLGQIAVVSSADPSRSVSLAQAVQQGDLRGVVYYWDEFGEEYKYTSDLNTFLLPHRGYWIKANRDFQIVFPPVFLPGSGREGGPASRSVTPNAPNNWRLQLVARTEEMGEDTQNFMGVAPNAGEGNAQDVEEPPTPIVEKVQLVILKGDRQLMQDVRPTAGGRWEYEFVVRAKVGEQIRLQWPNVRTLPKELSFRLTDLSTQRAINLRNASEHRFTASGLDRFKLVVDKQARGAPLITNVNVGAAGRGVNNVSISYTLAADATTEVRVLGTSGRAIASLERGRSATRGVNTLNWGLRDNAGRSVPAGNYIVEITATNGSGERVRAVRPVIVAR
jgi:hypothetical protein